MYIMKTLKEISANTFKKLGRIRWNSRIICILKHYWCLNWALVWYQRFLNKAFTNSTVLSKKIGTISKNFNTLSKKFSTISTNFNTMSKKFSTYQKKLALFLFVLLKFVLSNWLKYLSVSMVFIIRMSNY